MTLAVEDVNAKSDDVVEVHKYTFFLCPLDVGNIDDAEFVKAYSKGTRQILPNL